MSPGSQPARSVASVVVVIPCYNEEARLDVSQVEALLADERVRVLLVDDGSVDRTLVVLEQIHARHSASVTLLPLRPNRGKAEAVRLGLLAGLETGSSAIGYLDADFATPASEYLGLVDALMDSPDVDVVMGSRVAMLGTRIDRRPTRHYLGRMFATAASLALSATVYDTQCGAKVFRSSERVAEALEEPFSTRWAFDVELLSRLTRVRVRARRSLKIDCGRSHYGNGATSLARR